MQHRIILSVLLSLSFAMSWAQEKNMVQIKTFDQQMKPLTNLGVSINGKKFILLENKAVVFADVAKEDLPPKSVTISNDALEAESWNYSKGTLEIIIRKKNFKIANIKVVDGSDAPLKNVIVQFHGRKEISATTNADGVAQIPLSLDESITSQDQFTIGGYRMSGLRGDKDKMLVVQSLAPKPKDKEPEKEPQPELKEKPGFLADFKLSQLDSISSLTVFYAVFKNVDMSSLDEATRKKIDSKFNDLVRQLEKKHKEEFIGKISDSSFVETDVENLLAQARYENRLLDDLRSDFDRKIQIINEKISGGTSNLSTEERNKLLQDLNSLENVLAQNENKFYKNIAEYRTILSAIKSQFSDIQTLENKLTISETERLKDQEIFRSRIMLAVGIVIVFAILLVYLSHLRMKLERQKASLMGANNEIRRMNENLEALVFERTRLLMDANREMDIFLYRASHDLRSPICSIIGLCNIVRHSNGSEAFELIHKVSDTAFKMDKMLKKLRIISEINQPGNYVSISLPYMIDSITEQFTKFIHEHDIQVFVDCDESLNFYSYPNLIEVILYNLIDNALFFSSVKKNNRARVDVQAKLQENILTVVIQDNGIGIADNVRMKLWDMFFVGHEYSKGNGLGLYVVVKALQALKGTVDVQTEQDRFTRFVLTIPVNTRDINSLTRGSSMMHIAESYSN